MIAIGIDLSLTGTGITVLDNGKIILREIIKTKPTKEKRPIDEVKRIQSIISSILEIINEHNPDIAAIEGLAFMSRNTTALVQLAGLNYMLRAELVIRGIPFLIVAPTSLKKFATGKGNCQKDEIMLAIYKRWGVTITDNNIADSYILAQVCLTNNGSDTAKTSATQREVISLISSQLT